MLAISAHTGDMLLSLIALASMAPKTFTLTPKETVWVYANASSPGDGTFLRAWGVDGKSCPPDGEDAGQFSFSYLKWDVSEVPANAKLVSAKLEMYNTPDPGYSIEGSKKSPLEVRPLVGEFDAKTWTFDMSAKVHPASAPTDVFGSGYPLLIRPSEPVPFSVDLMAGPNLFGKELRAAVTSDKHQLNLCLTSALDPSADGRTSVFKVYGQSEAHENLRPRLVLKFDQ